MFHHPWQIYVSWTMISLFPDMCLLLCFLFLIKYNSLLPLSYSSVFSFFGQICRLLQIIILRLCKNKQGGGHLCIWQQIPLDGTGSRKSKGNHGIFLAWGKMLSQNKKLFVSMHETSTPVTRYDWSKPHIC
jgi:hypothetical protein